MKDIKRFATFGCEELREDGSYILYSDYEELLKRYEIMRKILMRCDDNALHSDCSSIELGPYTECTWTDKDCDCGAKEILEILEAD